MHWQQLLICSCLFLWHNNYTWRENRSIKWQDLSMRLRLFMITIIILIIFRTYNKQLIIMLKSFVFFRRMTSLHRHKTICWRVNIFILVQRWCHSLKKTGPVSLTWLESRLFELRIDTTFPSGLWWVLNLMLDCNSWRRWRHWCVCLRSVSVLWDASVYRVHF